VVGKDLFDWVQRSWRIVNICLNYASQNFLSNLLNLLQDVHMTLFSNCNVTL